MHHHHPPLPITTTAAATTTTANTSNGTTNAPPPPHNQQQPQQRRRKKRLPNNGTRVVEVRRGYNGFGFTISGQQPCRLSCIISNSPAEQAGLRAGDFLISVNGLNVSKLPHETVVQLIGNSFGSIRMQIAENYYSDSSDEENINASLMQQSMPGGVGRNGLLATNAVAGGLRSKPRFLHHKTKMHRLRNSPQKKREHELKLKQQQQQQRLQSLDSLVQQQFESQNGLRAVAEELPRPVPKPKVATTTTSTVASSSTTSDVANVSAMVRVVGSAALEYRAIVGYLGTIEMPKQISHSSKLQTVRSCIRKLRQEKRQPTVVLMAILPDCLRLQSSNGNVLATYASSRLNYVSSSSESENRFFGLVTSAVHNTQIDEEFEMEPTDDNKTATGHISISHSCHVFVIDTKLIEHTQHLQRANEFHIQCTRDPISNLCLEFPNNSEYVVNLIRSMYTMRILPPATRNLNDYEAGAGGGGMVGGAAHSPQPSNHSEISTTTSNSDSGIGFNNDCTNVSDRIVVVDFPGAAAAVNVNGLNGAYPLGLPPSIAQPSQRHIRPLGICCDVLTNTTSNDKRLTVRAMPDPKSPASLRRPNLLANFNLIKSPANSLVATRSCDDVLNLLSVDENADINSACAMMPPHISMDDISLHTATAAEDEMHTFLHPSILMPRKMRRSLQPNTSKHTSDVPHKLSPQVFQQTAQTAPKMRHSIGSQCIDDVQHNAVTPTKKSVYNQYCDPLDTWSSLQDLHGCVKAVTTTTTSCLLEATNSEPDLGNRELPSNASPFRRAWGQSSFRTPRTDKHLEHPCQQQASLRGSPTVRRTTSMTASDNDVYIKSMDGFIDDLKQTRNSRLQQHKQDQQQHQQQQSKQQKMGIHQVPQKLSVAGTSSTSASVDNLNELGGVASWGNSFERMLQDPAGMQTFSEFLKKEFSAENIYFWTACERYRLLENETERAALARVIFETHLSNAGTDPVNVDSHARNLTEEKLQSAEADIFAPAQKQIFNLMKFDSYQRFIRSDLYKSCLEAEEKHQTLPYTGEDLDELLKTNFHLTASAKLKKSASNAEDRRRKSLLPWHRKTRSKSRDRNELLAEPLNGQCAAGKSNTLMPPPPPSSSCKLAPLSSSSLRIASTQSSLSDLYSSRSSLSSFDANAMPSAELVCSLCRVILSNGATTIVPTRADETVGQLVERLLEKRGLTYQYYDVVINGCTKSLDMQLPSQMLAGKEVLIEQRVAFKLDLPDPKVISVKSKPKKQLHDVIRPILQKYNYSMSSVQVLLRDTQAPLDLQQPVTVADGQRLQIVLVKPQTEVQDFQQGGGINLPPPKYMKPTSSSAANKGTSNTNNIPPTVAKRTTACRNSIGSSIVTSTIPVSGNTNAPNNITAVPAQSTLDEITNKVFNELLQGKVDACGLPDKQRSNDLCSLKSDDCVSETSSIFDRLRIRDSSNIPGSKLSNFTKKKSTSSQHSEELQQNAASSAAAATSLDPKKPIIAKLKAGVKLQVTERVAEHQDELLEGLKRAQLARLEDQRGTEINFELPEFLKHKENSAASKLRKARANLSPINKTQIPAPLTQQQSTPMKSPTITEATTPTAHIEPPQPAPRLSITQKLSKTAVISPTKVDEACTLEPSDTNSESKNRQSTNSSEYSTSAKGPPPLPPKPKVLPIKPSNWGASAPLTSPTINNKIPIDINRKSLLTADISSGRCAYLDEPSSSFV